MLRPLLLAAVLLCFPAHAASPKLSMTGFGAVHIGASVTELGRALSKQIAPAADAYEASCRYVWPDNADAGISFMLLDGRLARIDVDSPGIYTLSGAAVGDTQASVIARYGPGLSVGPHAYEGPTGKYLTLYSKDKTYGVRFETDGLRVTRYYVGTAEAIQYIEGCG